MASSLLFMVTIHLSCRKSGSGDEGDDGVKVGKVRVIGLSLVIVASRQVMAWVLWKEGKWR